jgi:UDP-N-acetylglucosamine--N-acetylmuramyl-(pentapeptide) pyrophosphoryl-undecaprenol N-acetylglucosamine transferase
VLIMAGGTGGHVFPALAVARELAGRGYRIQWLGTRQGIEARLVPAAGFAIAFISVAGLRGKGVSSWLLAPLRLLRALAQALAVVRRQRPRVALGMGGFVAGPGGLAARLAGVPLVVHEQNAVAGLTNRVLARLASRVLEAFPASFPARVAALQTGNPVRAEIAALAPPEARFAGRSGPIRLLVLGGSQGATALNELAPEAVAHLAEPGAEVWHQSGRQQAEATAAAYQAARVNARVEAFIEDMAAAYAWADLVLCRAGALTITELAAAGVGSILVPYPHAVDDHQTRNARFLADAGAAVLMPQGQLTVPSLVVLVRGLQDRNRLLEMARRARALARPAATAEVVRHCLEVSHD